MIKRLILFLLANFGGLALGTIFTEAVTGDWYQGLNKAPWTPPGWVFGAAWSFIMVTFSIYLARALDYYQGGLRKEFLLIFAGAWLLNVIWNPIFFEFQAVRLGLGVIIFLTLFVFRFVQQGWRDMKWEWLLMLPYLLWILIATSLNAYIVWAN